MSLDDIERQSLQLSQECLKLEAFQNAQCIGCYWPNALEVQTQALIKEALGQGKLVALPKVFSADLQFYGVDQQALDGLQKHERFDVLEPDPALCPKIMPEQLDCLIVPGVAFTKDGQRLGQGGGYYDRFLKTLSAKTKTIGLALPCQCLAEIPVEDHDLAVDIVIF